MMRHLPLSGIRVLDFTLVWAGPYSVAMLSDMGAEVIRVESCQHHITNTRGFFAKPAKEIIPHLGTVPRLYADLDPGDEPWNRHALFNHLGRDRYSMTVDMRRADGERVLHDLVKISDVIVDNNTVGTLDRFHMGYEVARALNPTLVYVAMPIYGLSGPYRDYLGFGSNTESMSGLALLRSYADADPSSSGSSNHMDAASGVGAAFAALVALYDRERTGRGQLIEFCQIEHLIHQVGGPLMDAAMNHQNQRAIGNRDPVRAPQGVYPCVGEERWIAISVGTDDEWVGLCKAMGRGELASEPCYQTNHSRQSLHDELDTLISGWTRTQENTAAMALLQSFGVPAGITATDKDVFENPHLEARGFFKWVDHPSVGRRRYPSHPYKFSETPLRYDRHAPLLGEHNDLIYRQLLGLPEEEISRLATLGHIGNAYSEEAIRRG